MPKVILFSSSNPEFYAWVFFCPACEKDHPFDQRWEFNGDTESPTFSPSLLVYADNNGYQVRCHSFVRNGMIEYLNDCEHNMAGQTVEIPQYEISWSKI